MVKKLSSFFFLLLSSCGVMESSKSLIDFEFLPYLEEYKIDKERLIGTGSIRSISMTFRSLEPGINGHCVISRDKRYIEIDPSVWFSSTNEDRLVLFYHEMGHCDLNIMKHSDIYSIMNYYGISGVHFAANRDYYLRLLFLEGK